MLAMPLHSTRQRRLFRLFAYCGFFYSLQCVCSLSPSLMACTWWFPCFFWVVCHPSRTFPPKELEREPQNRLSPSPHRQTIPFLTSDSWPTTPVLAGYKWVVPESCACSTSMCVHGLPIVHAFTMTWGLVWSLLFLLLILDLLWRG